MDTGIWIDTQSPRKSDTTKEEPAYDPDENHEPNTAEP
jgi:hypothetical protein